MVISTRFFLRILIFITIESLNTKYSKILTTFPETTSHS
jgi:hypothetical protein